MQRDNDDDAWRSIVENYGDRPTLDREEPPEPVAPVWSSWDDPASSGTVDGAPERSDGSEELEERDWDEEERFVPPAPPPVPGTTPDRVVAWVGLFASPAVLLVCLIAGIHLPSWLGLLLVAAFVGGFGYLVAQMPRGPRDPWDDGAKL
ncbi:MAG: hypothetical protein ACXVEC_04245 [Nocardioides sp.]